LELRSREAELANQLKSEFLSNMSHEFRSPLHTVIGLVELLAKETVGQRNTHSSVFMTHIRSIRCISWISSMTFST
jgi:signal transduction histidine kinase